MIILDPDNYHLMSIAKQSVETANADCNAFFLELHALRNKYGLRDVYVIVSGNVKRADGHGEAEFGAVHHHGSEEKVLPMISWAYGRELAMREEALKNA
jgi:hypothetical protein